MRFLATYIMRGRLQAMFVAALSGSLATLLWVLVPLSLPLSWASAAVVGLVTLVQGPFEGLLAVIGAAVLAGVLFTLGVGTPAPAFGLVLALWLPAWLVAHFVRLSGSLSLGLLAVAGVGVLIVLGVYLVVGDPTPLLHEFVKQDILAAADQSANNANQEQLKAAMDQLLVPTLTGRLVAGTMIGWIISLLLARWWQAQLVRPEGFRREFHGLRLGRSAAVAAVLLMVAPVVIPGGALVAKNLAWVVGVPFLMQGLAVVHGSLAQQRASTGWLIGLYMALFFSVLYNVTSPYGVGLLAVVGLADNWVDFRARVGTPRE